MSREHGRKGQLDRATLRTFYTAQLISFEEFCQRCPDCDECRDHKQRRAPRMIRGSLHG